MEPISGPSLKPKQRKDGTWYAEAVWPSSPSEDVGHFKSAADVREWIANAAIEYFRRRAEI